MAGVTGRSPPDLASVRNVALRCEARYAYVTEIGRAIRRSRARHRVRDADVTARATAVGAAVAVGAGLADGLPATLHGFHSAEHRSSEVTISGVSSIEPEESTSTEMRFFTGWAVAGRACTTNTTSATSPRRTVPGALDARWPRDLP